MPRWKPPQQRSSPYITPEGARALNEELKGLWLLRRQDIVPALRAAAAEGDRSENAEYIYRKKQLREVDRRIRYLSRRLDEVQVVHGAPPSRGRVYFGATVSVEDQEGRERRYRIVGADEIDPARNWISVDWPVARALLGREVDEGVEVQLPEGRIRLYLLEIQYR